MFSLFGLIFLGVCLGAFSQRIPNVTDGGTSYISKSKLGTYRHAAVCANAGICSTVGRMMLERGGSAVDATLATLICDGVLNPFSLGLGGGFVMTVYDARSAKSDAIISRERAPAAATEDMFDQPHLALDGALAVAVPGEIPGYWAVHQKYGRLPWYTLFQPTIEMCRDGVPVTGALAKAINTTRAQRLLRNPDFHLGEIFFPDNSNLSEGDYVKRPKLAKTLEKIAKEGITGYEALAESLASDIQTAGGIITAEDIIGYKPTWVEPIRVHLANTNVTIHSVPPPASGAVLASIMGILDQFHLSPANMTDDDSEIATLHLMAEAFKFAYAKRSLLGDAEFVDVKEVVDNMTSLEFFKHAASRIRADRVLGGPEDYGARFYAANDSGTAHFSVVDSDGNAVAVTSTINIYFGSGLRSQSTGIILNNQMNDFGSPSIKNHYGLPPTKSNFIQPGKRPQSSTAPSIFVGDDGELRLVVGSAGGSKITSGISYVSARFLWLGDDVKQAVDARRIHHQLIPNVLKMEKGIPSSYADKLDERGQITLQGASPLSTVCAVGKAENQHSGFLQANADYRRGGDVAGY